MEKLRDKKYQSPGMVLAMGALLVGGSQLRLLAETAPPAHTTAVIYELPPRESNLTSRDSPVHELPPPTKTIKLVPQPTKPAAVPQQHAETHPTNSYSPALQTWLDQLGQCESGNNPRTNTGNGFYGEFQFTIDTWNSLHTGYARADLAPEAVQEAAIIANTNRSSGGLATQNPGCYHSLHLSQFPPK